jgi:predicted RNase H-like HicB family nuclease
LGQAFVQTSPKRVMRLSSASCTIMASKALCRKWTRECAVQEQGHRYEIDIFWSEEDGCFIACVPDLDNCAAWGMTYEEALSQAHAAIRADLASRRRGGEPVPEPTPRVLA